MSGWDEGGVYYSDEAQFPRSGGDQADATNRHKALQKFKEFIRNFQHKSQHNVFPYREALLSNPKYLLVDLADLISYDPDQTLPQFLRENPADYLPLVSKNNPCECVIWSMCILILRFILMEWNMIFSLSFFNNFTQRV